MDEFNFQSYLKECLKQAKQEKEDKRIKAEKKADEELVEGLKSKLYRASKLKVQLEMYEKFLNLIPEKVKEAMWEQREEILDSKENKNPTIKLQIDFKQIVSNTCLNYTLLNLINFFIDKFGFEGNADFIKIKFSGTLSQIEEALNWELKRVQKLEAYVAQMIETKREVYVAQMIETKREVYEDKDTAYKEKWDKGTN